jgi:filamentous hemagglutinin
MFALLRQQVWAQTLPSGDATLQTFIVQNASSLSGSTGMSYQATTSQFTQYSAGVSGTVMLPFVGGSGGVNVGISTDGTFSGTSTYIQVQADGMASAGAYAGVSGSVGISHTNGPLLSGSSTGGYAELDGGFGPSGGANFSINDNGTIG